MTAYENPYSSSTRWLRGNLHAVEIFNGLRESIGCDETANLPLWDELLTGGKRLWACANDDFHFALISPGHGWVCVQVPEGDEPASWQAIVAQLKAGAFYASTYPLFEQITLEGGILRIAGGRRVQRLLVIGPGGDLWPRPFDPAVTSNIPSTQTDLQPILPDP